MAQNLSLKLASFAILILFIAQPVTALTCSDTTLNITDLTNIDLSGMTNTYGIATGVLFAVKGITDFANPQGNPEDKGFRYLDQDIYNDQDEINFLSTYVSISEEDRTPDIEAGDTLIVTYDGAQTTTVFFPQLDGNDVFFVADDGSTYFDANFTNFAYGASGCLPSTCFPPAAGNWDITNGDDCTLSVTTTITGNLNISNGSLSISSSLTIQGGFIFIEKHAGISNNLTIESGGQING